MEINKGTGAGGANTNYYGKQFEEKTNNQQRLIDDGFIKQNIQPPNSTNKRSNKNNYYLNKKISDNKTITFVMQNGLKTFLKSKYDIDIFRCPDEAYIIEDTQSPKTVIKILEKKEQRVNGSVETKLWSGQSLKREYEISLGDDFVVQYGFCVSSFLKNKLTSSERKYQILNIILNESNIPVLFGDDENYFETLDNWIYDT